MDIREIKDLLTQFDQSSLTEFDLREGSFELYMNKNTVSQVKDYSTRGQEDAPVEVKNTVTVTETEEEAKTAAEKATFDQTVDTGEEITSPLVGIVYLQPAPDKESFKQVGDKVKKGEVVCIIEAMKLMNEITSAVDGTISEILVENEEVVEFGQPLFKVD